MNKQINKKLKGLVAEGTIVHTAPPPPVDMPKLKSVVVKHLKLFSFIFNDYYFINKTTSH